MIGSTGRTDPASRTAAIVVTVAMTFGWLPGVWFFHVGRVLRELPDPWPWYLASLILAVALTIWAPQTFGLTWANTWSARRVIAIVGGGMTTVAIVGMLFIRVPFYLGSSAIFLIVPLAEELLFRGFLYAVLDQAFPRVWHAGRFPVSTATIVTAIAFGWHLGGLRLPADGFILFQVIYTTIAGFLFAYMRQETGSVWGPWLVHFIVNAWAARVPGFWAL